VYVASGTASTYAHGFATKRVATPRCSAAPVPYPNGVNPLFSGSRADFSVGSGSITSLSGVIVPNRLSAASLVATSGAIGAIGF